MEHREAHVLIAIKQSNRSCNWTRRYYFRNVSCACSYEMKNNNVVNKRRKNMESLNLGWKDCTLSTRIKNIL